MFVGQDEAGTRSMKKKGTNTQVRENGICGGETQINTRGDKITCAVVTECRSKTEGSVAVRRITSTTGKLPFVMISSGRDRQGPWPGREFWVSEGHDNMRMMQGIE